LCKAMLDEEISVTYEEEEEEEDVEKLDTDEDEDDEVAAKLCSDEDNNKMEYRPTDVSFHRPTNTEELLSLHQEDSGDILTLFGGEDGIITIEDLIIVEIDADCEEKMHQGKKMSVPLSKLKHLEKLMKLLSELISTEIDYVRDLAHLCTFLDECTYCSKPAVHSFVNSTTFIGE